MAGYSTQDKDGTVYAAELEALATGSCQKAYADNYKLQGALAKEVAAASGNVGLSSRFLALEAAVQNSLFGGLYAGSVTTGIVQPTANHVEIPVTNLTLNINDYPNLYSRAAPFLTSWSTIVSGSFSDLYGIVYAGDRYVIAGSQAGLYSTDGISVIAATTPPSGNVRSIAWNGVTGAGSVVVGVGLSDYVGTTTGATAGASWATQSSGAAAITWADVKYFAGAINKFVMIGYKETAPDVFESYIRSSADGVTWALERTQAGYYTSIAYNDNYATSDEFMIVGVPNLGDTTPARISATLNGTWAQAITFGGASANLISVAYYDDGAARGFAVCGFDGVVGVKSIGAVDISAASSVPNSPRLDKVVADDTNGVFYALGEPVAGTAYIYEASVTDAGIAWAPQSVGTFSLNDYAVDGANNRIVCGNSGTLFKFTGASDTTFTINYPYSAAVANPFKVWLLTEDAGTPTGGSSGALPSIDISKLADNWQTFQIAETGSNITGFAQSNDGVIVAYGEDGFLYKSDDGAATWAEVDLGVSISGDIIGAEFMADGKLFFATGNTVYIASATLDSVVDSDSSDTPATVIANSTNIVALEQPNDTATTLFTIYNLYAQNTGSTINSGAYLSKYSGYVDETLQANLCPAGYNNVVPNGSCVIPLVVDEGNGSKTVLTNALTPPIPTGGRALNLLAEIPDFVANNQAYNSAWEEYLVMGYTAENAGVCYVSNKTLGNFRALTLANNDYQINDAIGIADKCWLLLTGRGIHVVAAGAAPVFYSSATAASGNRGIFVSANNRYKVICNAGGIAGAISICDITGRG